MTGKPTLDFQPSKNFSTICNRKRILVCRACNKILEALMHCFLDYTVLVCNVLLLIYCNFLGGQAKTLMFVHISPEINALGETLSTLNFAERVSSVELGAARANKESVEVKGLKEEVWLLDLFFFSANCKQSNKSNIHINCWSTCSLVLCVICLK